MSAGQPAVAEPRTAARARSASGLRKCLAFGTGVGIRLGKTDLEALIVRVRPGGASILAAASIEGFRERPAAEWGAEYSRFLTRNGAGHLAATVLLPRREVIVRQLSLPGVAPKDIAAAIGFQIDTLHPYGEDDAAYAWTRLGDSGAVLLGIVRRGLLERYLEMFAEAGVAVASLTFSAAVLHAASRLLTVPPGEGFLAAGEEREGTVEIYGESPSRLVFSAEFDETPERAAALARAELRLPEDAAPAAFNEFLPAPAARPEDCDLSRNALPYATALAGACPRLAPAANLVPEERRSASSRAMFIPTAILAVLLIFTAAAALGYSKIRDRRYLARLEAGIAQIGPQAQRASSLDSEIERTRARARLLDDFRARSKADLDALNALTLLLAPPIWANSVELSRDGMQIGGEAEQAAALLQLIDSSPFFQNSQFTVPIARGQGGEIFRIRADREGRR